MKKILLLGLSLFIAPSLAGTPDKSSQNNPYPVVQLVVGLVCSVPFAIVYACYLDAKEQWPKAPTFNQAAENFFNSMHNNGSDS